MKVRVGFGLGTQGLADDQQLETIVDDLERLAFDSLWLSERITGGAVDPVVGLAFAAGRTRQLKLGTSVLVLPGRNPVVLAKELASLDRLSNGRLLPAFGLGIADPAEQQAFGVERGERAAWFDEALPLLRRLWTGEPVDHQGARFAYAGVRVAPTPVQQPLDVWLGGISPAECRRVGRLGDGWLPSFFTPESAAKGRVVIEVAADEAGRAIDAEHFGALVIYRQGELRAPLVAAVKARRPDLDVDAVVPNGYTALRTTLEAFIDEGFSKFVVVPAFEPESWTAELEALADAVLPLQVRVRK